MSITQDILNKRNESRKQSAEKTPTKKRPRKAKSKDIVPMSNVLDETVKGYTDSSKGFDKELFYQKLKEARIDVELVGFAAEDAGNADAYRAVRGESYVKRGIVARGSFVILAIFDRSAIGIGAFEPYPVRRQLENVDSAHNSASARGTAVSDRGRFGF